MSHKPNDFIFVKDTEENTIDEYMITYNKHDLEDYTKTLLFDDGQEMLIKELLERPYLRKYTDIKGILSFNKLEYINNYLNNSIGASLIGTYSRDIDYDSSLSQEEKSNIILNYLNCMTFTLVNQHDLDLINESYKMFQSMNVAGMYNATNSYKLLLSSAENAKNIFDKVGFKVKEKHYSRIRKPDTFLFLDGTPD